MGEPMSLETSSGWKVLGSGLPLGACCASPGKLIITSVCPGRG
ncbi:rCG63509 [Rattus norvegicus]|uniref:RCG63509 n=1 Tax=Rattus norvegicus TaxID=10116 RepID=A6HKA5_RAT|nr:rCG63509 [Rattus norvegicus]